MNQDNPIDPLIGTARTAALAGGVTGLVSLLTVIGGETVMGTDFMTTTAATVAAWLAFASTCLLVLGVTGLLCAGWAAPGARRTLWGMQLAATVMIGAAATLPLVVVGIVDRAPDLVSDPPMAVPATFILAGAALGISGIGLSVQLRRTGAVPARLTTLLIVGSVVAIVPLPSRHFLLAFAVAALLAHARPGGTAQPTEAEPASQLR